MTQQLNMSIHGYGRIERNEVDVSMERAHQITEVLCISLIELISFDDKYIFNNYAQITNGGSVVNSQIHSNDLKVLLK